MIVTIRIVLLALLGLVSWAIWGPDDLLVSFRGVLVGIGSVVVMLGVVFVVGALAGLVGEPPVHHRR